MTGLILPQRRLILPGDPPPARARGHMPPAETRLRCSGCGAVQATRERRPWTPEALAAVRCPVCRHRGAALAPMQGQKP